MQTSKQYADKFNEQVATKMAQYNSETSFWKEFPANMAPFTKEIFDGLIKELTDKLDAGALEMPIEVGLKNEAKRLNNKWISIVSNISADLGKGAFKIYWKTIFKHDKMFRKLL